VSVHDPGPCETLARLALQSERYAEDPDFRDAVNAVLGQPVFDAAPRLLEAAKNLVRYLEEGRPTTSEGDSLVGRGYLQAKIAIAKAEGA
jgi:aspartate/methionine/tyrosine aminotransferase